MILQTESFKKILAINGQMAKFIPCMARSKYSKILGFTTNGKVQKNIVFHFIALNLWISLPKIRFGWKLAIVIHKYKYDPTSNCVDLVSGTTVILSDNIAALSCSCGPPVNQRYIFPCLKSQTTLQNYQSYRKQLFSIYL